MASKKTQKRKSTRNEKKVLHTIRLAPEKISAAQRILGTANATATIEMALDLVSFPRELVRGTLAMYGIKMDQLD